MEIMEILIKQNHVHNNINGNNDNTIMINI